MNCDVCTCFEHFEFSHDVVIGVDQDFWAWEKLESRVVFIASLKCDVAVGTNKQSVIADALEAYIEGEVDLLKVIIDLFVVFVYCRVEVSIVFGAGVDHCLTEAYDESKAKEEQNKH